MTRSSQLVLIALLLATSCAHAPRTSPNGESAPKPADWKTTSVEIEYKLRHTERKLTIAADAQGVHGRSVVDGSQLKQCQIDAARYEGFLAKVQSFIEHRREPASTQTSKSVEECRAPYKIVLKNPKDTSVLEGCRLSDEGAFSHLVQEGEFLIYRQK